MTVKDKERFDKIFCSSKFFEDITDMDLLRVACECEKLFDFLQDENIVANSGKSEDTRKFMVFAYWLGVINTGGTA